MYFVSRMQLRSFMPNGNKVQRWHIGHDNSIIKKICCSERTKQKRTCLPEVGIPRRQPGTHRRGPPHCQHGTSYCHYPLPETWREIIHMVSNIRVDTFQWLQDTDMRPNTTNTNKNQLLQNLHYFMISYLQLCTLLKFVSWLSFSNPSDMKRHRLLKLGYSDSSTLNRQKNWRPNEEPSLFGFCMSWIPWQTEEAVFFITKKKSKKRQFRNWF